jgi:hypothetical protein
VPVGEGVAVAGVLAEGVLLGVGVGVALAAGELLGVVLAAGVAAPVVLADGMADGPGDGLAGVALPTVPPPKVVPCPGLS